MNGAELTKKRSGSGSSDVARSPVRMPSAIKTTHASSWLASSTSTQHVPLRTPWATGRRHTAHAVSSSIRSLTSCPSPRLPGLTSRSLSNCSRRAARCSWRSHRPRHWPTWTCSPPPKRSSSGSIYVVFQHRHGSGARRAHDLLKSGALGIPQVVVCETLWYRPDSYFLPEWRGNWAGEGGGPTLGHGIHQIDLLLHLMGSWETVDARAARIARPVEFEDVSLAIVMFDSGAAGTVVTSLLSPRELSRIRIDTTGGTLEVNHVYGYSDADWSWTPAPDATTAASLGRDPGLSSAHDSENLQPAGSDDVWAASAGLDLPSNHAAQIDRLVDDMLAGRRHDTTLASTRPTMEFITAVYASSIECETVHRRDLIPANRFYDSLSGGLSPDTVTARLAAGRL